jgi:hypothetical protein
MVNSDDIHFAAVNKKQQLIFKTQIVPFICNNSVGYVLYSLHVCVWTRQIRKLHLMILIVVMSVSCASGAFLGESRGGAGMSLPGYAQRSAPGPQNYFLGGFFYF